MRLVLFGPGRPFRGGIASTTTALALAMQARGHQLLFLGPRRQYPAFLYPGPQDIDPEVCAEIPGAEFLYAPLEPWAWNQAICRAREFQADVWLFPYWTWAWAPFLRSLLWSAGSTPVVAIAHNQADHGAGFLQRGAARLVLGKCDGLMTHAGRLAEGLRADFPGREIAIHLLPPPAMPKVRASRNLERQKLGLGEGERLALFLGLIRPYKGVDLLIEAFAGLPSSSPWRLVVAGEAWGELGGGLEAAVEGFGLADRVSLHLRWLREEEVEALLAAADLLVLPYRSGSQSAVAPLALSRGVPILSTRVGGLAELVRDGVNGRLVEPGSPKALLSALESMGGEELEDYAGRASASVEDLNWNSYAETLEKLVRGLVASA